MHRALERDSELSAFESPEKRSSPAVEPFHNRALGGSGIRGFERNLSEKDKRFRTILRNTKTTAERGTDGKREGNAMRVATVRVEVGGDPVELVIRAWFR